MRLFASTKWGVVYVIRCGDFYKIGRTEGTAEDRMRKLQAGNPHKLELVCTLPDPDPCEVERILHDAYRSRRVSGEWFQLSAMDLDSIRFEAEEAHQRQKLGARRY